jgi:hypothetical protein
MPKTAEEAAKHAARIRAWRRANPEKARAIYQRWKAANPDKARASLAAAKAKKPEKYKAHVREWRLANAERNRAVIAAWRAANQERVRELSRTNTARYRAARLQRTPAWADSGRIRVVYEAAAAWSRELGVEFHVDHCVPLQGELVSGLHVHNNLKIIPGVDNLRKSNRFEVTQ